MAFYGTDYKQSKKHSSTFLVDCKEQHVWYLSFYIIFYWIYLFFSSIVSFLFVCCINYVSAMFPFYRLRTFLEQEETNICVKKDRGKEGFAVLGWSLFIKSNGSPPKVLREIILISESAVSLERTRENVCAHINMVATLLYLITFPYFISFSLPCWWQPRNSGGFVESPAWVHSQANTVGPVCTKHASHCMNQVQ